MTKTKRDRTELRTVTISMRLARYEYDAAQRWAGLNRTSLTNAMTSGLKLLPGMTQLQLEEKEAHANEINEANRREEEAKRHIEDSISNI